MGRQTTTLSNAPDTRLVRRATSAPRSGRSPGVGHATPPPPLPPDDVDVRNRQTPAAPAAAPHPLQTEYTYTADYAPPYSFRTSIRPISHQRLQRPPSAPGTMPAYHSVFLDEPNQQVIGNFALLPLRTRTRGPAMQLPALPGDVTELTIDASHESYDPLDETISLFRANTFFRNFEIKGPADRVLIYGILYTSEVIKQIKPNMSRRDAEKAVMNTALDTNFAIPGDATFPLNQAFEPPRDRNEAEVLRQYISQMRQELAVRLLNRIYADGPTPSKWWLSFTKRKFMGKSL
ncbi:hypothetical protein MBLNU459_g5808t1 [Dothideomycetes sp. NU459]